MQITQIHWDSFKIFIILLTVQCNLLLYFYLQYSTYESTLQKEEEQQLQLQLPDVEENELGCLTLDLNGTLDKILESSTKQVFLIMPAKAAGSSMKDFTRKCLKSEFQSKKENNHLFLDEIRKDFILDQDTHLNSIITSHAHNSLDVLRIIRNAHRDTLTIYIHRDETDRLVSSIRQVIQSFIINDNLPPRINRAETIIHLNETHCILNQNAVVDIIQQRIFEIGVGAPNILTCDLYEQLLANDPSLVFIHYRQVNKLQKVLAKHYCPEFLIKSPIAVNVGDEKKMSVFLLRHDSDGEENTIKLETWLEQKKKSIEWALDLRSTASCQGKTKHMEDMLFSCSDEALKVTTHIMKDW